MGITMLREPEERINMLLESKKFGGTHDLETEPKDTRDPKSDTSPASLDDNSLDDKEVTDDKGWLPTWLKDMTPFGSWFGDSTGIPPAPKPEVIRSGMWKGSEGVGGKDPDASGAYDSQGNLNPGWVLDRDNKPHWAPLWDKKDAQVLRYSIDDTDHRIRELQLELETRQKLVVNKFFENLSSGELVQCVNDIPSKSVYGPSTVASGGYQESYEIFPEIHTGATMMFLGLVSPPGEDIVLTGVDGSQKVWRVTGPKWLIEDKVWVSPVPLGSIQPYEVEIEDEFAQNLGLDLEVINLEGEDLEEGEDD